MKLRMYLPEEIAELKSKFQFFADTDSIYVLNKMTKLVKSFKHGEPIKHYHLFDIHNAVMMCRINSEEPTWDNVEKYL